MYINFFKIKHCITYGKNFLLSIIEKEDRNIHSIGFLIFYSIIFFLFFWSKEFQNNYKDQTN